MQYQINNRNVNGHVIVTSDRRVTGFFDDELHNLREIVTQLRLMGKASIKLESFEQPFNVSLTRLELEQTKEDTAVIFEGMYMYD